MKSSPALKATLLVLVSGFIFFAAPALAAQKMWIVDNLQLTVRTGPSVENKIIALLNTGDWVEVLKENNEGWAKVRTAKGKEGWLLKRYLMEERPAVLRLAELSPQAQETAEKMETLHKENAELKAKVEELEALRDSLEETKKRLASGDNRLETLISENTTLKSALAKTQSEAASAQESYDKLVADSGNVVTLQKQRDQLAAELEQKTKKLADQDNELESLRFAGSLKWFLAGAGVLIVGWLMGLALHRRKKRYGNILD